MNSPRGEDGGGDGMLERQNKCEHFRRARTRFSGRSGALLKCECSISADHARQSCHTATRAPRAEVAAHNYAILGVDSFEMFNP